MNLDGRQRQFTDDIRVLDGQSLFYGLALDPLGGKRRAGNRRSATEGLELGFFNDIRFRIDLHLQLHDVAAFRSADQAGPHIGIFLRQAPDIAGIVIVIDYFFAICHGSSAPYRYSNSCRKSKSFNYPRAAAKAALNPALWMA